MTNKQNTYHTAAQAVLGRIASFIIRRWGWVLIAAFLVTGGSAVLASKIELDTDITHLLPSGDRAVADFNEAARHFGFADKLIVVVNGPPGADGRVLDFMDKYAELAASSPLVKNVEYKMPYISFNERAKRMEDKFNIQNVPYRSQSGGKYLMFISPVKPAGDIEFAARIMDEAAAVEAITREATRLAEADITVGYAGGYAITLGESSSMKSNVSWSLATSLIVVMLIFLAGFKRPYVVFIVCIPLLAAIVWTLAAAVVMIGSLNVMTIAFAAILAGLGIDFGIHIYNRYLIELSTGKDVPGALKGAIVAVGEGMFYSCLTTAAAFYSLLFMKFGAAAQFGLLVGTGVILCMAAMVFVLPSLILMISAMAPRGAPAPASVYSLDFLSAAVEKHAKKIAIGIIVSLAVCSLYAFTRNGFPGFDNDLDNMSSRGNKAIAVQKDILKVFGNYYEPVVIIAKGKDPDEVVRSMGDMTPFLAALTQSGELVKYESIFKYLPPAERRRELYDKIERFRSPTGLFGKLVRTFRTPENDIDALLDKLARDPSKKDEYEYLAEKRDDILFLLNSDISPDECKYDELKRMLPDVLFAKFLAKDKESGIYYAASYVYPKERVVKESQIKALAGSLGVDGKNLIMTGMGLMAGNLEKLVVSEVWAIITVIMTVLALILAVVYRKIFPVIISMAVVVSSLWATVLIMALCGLKFNYMNIVAFPLIFGMGIDDSIYMLHRYLEKNTRNIRAMINDTGRAVILTSLTTMAGFGSLVFSGHSGLISLGITAFTGMGVCLCVSLFVLPGLIVLADKKI